MSIIDHVFLFLFLFIYIYIWSKYNYNINNNYKFWILALIPILLYAFIVGTRYGWGADYIGYKERLEQAFTYEEEQVGFRWLNQAISILGFNYVGGYIIYSLIFITSAFVLIRGYGRESKYMYAFLIPATLTFITGIIRQGVALSFLFLALYFFNKRNWIGLLISIIIGASIHSSTIITVAMVGAIFVFIHKPISWKLTIPTYLFFTFIYDISQTAIIANYLQTITLQNKFQSYLENSDRWFGKDAINSIYEQSTFALLMSSLFYISVIYIGFQTLKYKPNKKVSYLYNSMTIGIILYRIVFQFEILRRFAAPLEMLYFIVLGYSIITVTNYKKDKIRIALLQNNKINPMKFPLRLYRIGMVFIISYLLIYWGRFVFLNPNAMFYWNQ